MIERGEDLLALSLASAFHDKSLAASPAKLERKMRELLQLEKRRRGLDESQLVFIGMANVANYYWCAMKSLLQSRVNELMFFETYLSDRISYSFELGLISDMPTSVDELLAVGENITFSDVERLLKKRADSNRELGIIWEAATVIKDEGGKDIMIINPDIPTELKEQLAEDAKARGIRIAGLEELPKLRGEIVESTRRERYPTIRWNFSWGNYVVNGVPDGITDTFVYEFKTTRNRFLMYYLRPVAFAQADLYGYFFKRKRKRVQVHVMEEDRTETWEEDVDDTNAIQVLSSFERVDKGEKPLPPKEWKCRSCELRRMCESVKERWGAEFV
jgi:CRISPR/Cas system-associated exonuclease Cas4 (RecB family)